MYIVQSTHTYTQRLLNLSGSAGSLHLRCIIPPALVGPVLTQVLFGFLNAGEDLFKEGLVFRLMELVPGLGRGASLTLAAL